MVDLGHGRGWLNPGPAASIHRIDRALGHPLQITEAGRTWDQQKAHWDTYQRVGHPIALHPDAPSIHQIGAAIDSDEAQKHIALMTEHGWIRTVWRNGRLVEPWHFEHQAHRDQHRFDAEPASNPELPPLPEGKTMADVKQIHWMNGKNVGGRALLIPGTAWAVPFTEAGATYANRSAAQFDTGNSVEYTKSLFDAFLSAGARCAPTAVKVEIVNADA